MSPARSSSRESGSRPPLLARVLGEGESPTWWGLPLGRIRGCEIRLHLVALLYVALTLAHAVWSAQGVPYVATGLIGLAAVVCLHEAVRIAMLARRTGVRVIGVTLWPLGGVWSLDREGGRFEGEAAASVGAFAVVGLLAIVLAGLVYALTGSFTDVVFNPLRPGVVLTGLQGGTTMATLGLVAVWQFYAMSVYFLGANLLPMLPLDGGVVLRSWLAARGSPPATAAQIGLAIGVALLGAGVLTGATLLAGLGVCGVVVCWSGWQAERFAVDPAGLDRWRVLADETAGHESPISVEERTAVERVLAKISESGMESLSRQERKLLQAATARLRRS